MSVVVIRRAGIGCLLLFLAGTAGCTKNYGIDRCRPNQAPPVENYWAGEGISDVTFLAFGDSQFGGGADNKNDLLVQALNVADAQLRWNPFGVDAPVDRIRGVIIAGDLTQNGRDGRTFSDNEYGGFTRIYGLTGNRILRFPVYEGYGNHDYFEWNNIGYRIPKAHPVADSVAVRNFCRPHLTNRAPGLHGHYSWDWDNFHFVNVNLAASDVDPHHEVPGVRDPRMALSFLQDDLLRFVYGTTRKVVIFSHYGPWETFEWDQAQIDALYEAIRDYPVAAYLHGHAHATSTYTWNGIPVFNLGSPYYLSYNADGRGHFTALRFTDEKLYSMDVAYDPATPTQLVYPARWSREVDLAPVCIEVPFDTVDQGVYSGVSSRSLQVIRTDAQWAALWSQLTANRIPPPPAPVIDFQQNMLIAALDGTRPSGGYSIAVESVVETPGWMVVHVTSRAPRPGDIVTLALTQPYHIVSLAASGKPVEFNHTATTR